MMWQGKVKWPLILTSVTKFMRLVIYKNCLEYTMSV